jgi:hypothetical protein
MQLSELALQQHVIVVRAGDVAGPARAGAAARDRLVHGREYLGMLSHAEIVVGAPDDHLAGTALTMMRRQGEAAGLALEIGEDAVASFAPKPAEFLKEKRFVIHDVLP